LLRALPVSWREEIEEIHRRRRLAEQGGGAEAVARQHAAGRLTVRERIARLLDPGSFQEVGALAGRAEYDAEGRLASFVPYPYVAGIGRIEGRPVAVGGEDFTVRGGSGAGGGRRKGGQGGFIEDLAYHYRIPLVNLVDGVGGSVETIAQRGYASLPGSGQDGFERSVALLGIVPVVSAVMGTAAGGPSGRALLAHWTIMVRGTSQIFAAGPPVVERACGLQVDKEALGGAAMAVDTAGTIDNAAESEEACLAQIRRFLSYLPANVWELPPPVPCEDSPERREEALADIIPRSARQPYDMRRLIALVVDRDSMFEIQPTFGRALITCLARLAGKTVGVIASNPMYGGVVDAKAARKQAHFTELCDTFHIPLVFFVDAPGFQIGPEAEAAGTLRFGMLGRYLNMQLTVPVFTVVVRKCYGMAGGNTLDRAGLNFKIAWPSAEWGSLPVEGGVRAAFRREIESAPDPQRREREIEQALRRLASPFRTAEAFAVEDLIDPRETRPYLCRFLEAAWPGMKTRLGPKHRVGVRP
jgi:acetyl-CoA carboxylase carboxyltransferase component